MKGVLKYLVIVTMVLSLLIPPTGTVLAEEIPNELLAVDFTCVMNGNWTEGVTWGGATFPGTGDTWVIPEGFTVNMTGNQSCGTGWNNGTLTFNATTGSTSLTIDNGAIITNNGIINASFTPFLPIPSSVDKTMSFIGHSLEVITGNQPVWGFQSYWNFTEIDFQFDIETGDNGNTFQINGTCRFDDLLIENGDKVYGNAETLEFDGNFTYTGTGRFHQETSNVRFISNATTNIGTWYNITIDDNTFLEITTNVNYENIMTIDGTTGGGITGADYWVAAADEVETPLVIGSNGLLTGIGHFAYIYTGAGNYNITASNNYGDLRIYTLGIPGISSATMLGAITCNNLTVYSGSPIAPMTFETGANDLTINYGLSVGVSFATTFNCDDSTIDIGEDGITLVGSSTINGETSIIQSDGDLGFASGTFTPDTNTIIMTDNASITGDVSFYNLTIDTGKLVTTYDDDNNMMWSGLMIVNGTLDTLTNSDSMNLDFNTAGGEILRIGPSGSLASADIEIWGDGYYEIPATTYNNLMLNQDNVGTNQYNLTGNIIVTEVFNINAVTDDTRNNNFFTNDYDITCGSLTLTGSGDTVVSFNASTVDIGTSGIIIAATGILNGNTSTTNLAGEWNNSGLFVPGTSVVNLDGTGVQYITTNGDSFATLNITNTNDVVVFLDDTNITTSTWVSGAEVMLNSNMTISIFTCNNVIIRSSDTSIERYLFAPLSTRTIDGDATFINVTLVPPITLSETIFPLLLSLLPVVVLVIVFRGVMNSLSFKPTNKKRGPKK